jgi:hypothetical protein
MRAYFFTGIRILLLGTLISFSSQAVGMLPTKAEDQTFGAAKALEEGDLKTVDRFIKKT